MTKKKKPKPSSSRRSHSSSPSSSSKSSGVNQQNSSQTSARSTPDNCDLVAAEEAGSDTSPILDLQPKLDATVLSETDATDASPKGPVVIPSSPIIPVVEVTPDTPEVQSAPLTTVESPEAQIQGATVTCSEEQIDGVSAEVPSTKSALLATVGNPEPALQLQDVDPPSKATKALHDPLLLLRLNRVMSG
ncbi:hypothetical protein Rs2_50012 [Raphanus sativus]|nr:hypothetical protein Rs2_50012 [Raphanus sativus]